MNPSNSNTSLRRLQALRASALAVAIVWFAGCHTAGYKKSDAVASNSQQAAKEVSVENQELDATIVALNDLVNRPAADAEPQFLKFSQALDRLVAATGRAEREVDRVWSSRTRYLAAWEREIPTIHDQATRSLSEVRKSEVSNQFDAANRQFNEAQNALQPLIAFLHDIRKALSTDLTRDGLAAIKPSVTNANERARQAQTALSQSAADLDTLSARTASFRVQDTK